MNSCKWLIIPLLFAGLGISAAAQTKSAVVEEIVARVNNDIITREDLERAHGVSRRRSTRIGLTSCSDAENSRRSGREADKRTLLRRLIDQSLLVQRAKDQRTSTSIPMSSSGWTPSARKTNCLPWKRWGGGGGGGTSQERPGFRGLQEPAARPTADSGIDSQGSGLENHHQPRRHRQVLQRT